MTASSPDEWTPIAVDFFSHPKAIEAGLRGRSLFIVGLCYCQKHLTDGAIPRSALALLAVEAGVKPAIYKVLVQVGLWHDAEGGGWTVNGWGEWNRGRAEIEERREVRREASHLANHKRWHADRGVTDPTCSVCRSQSDPKSDSGSDRSAESDQLSAPRDSPPTQTPSPTPPPSPTDSDPTGIARPGAVATAPAEEEDPRHWSADTKFDWIVSRLADTQLDGTTGVRNRGAWLTAARATIATDQGPDIRELLELWPERQPWTIAEEIDPMSPTKDEIDSRHAGAKTESLELQRRWDEAEAESAANPIDMGQVKATLAARRNGDSQSADHLSER